MTGEKIRGFGEDIKDFFLDRFLIEIIIPVFTAWIIIVGIIITLIGSKRTMKIFHIKILAPERLRNKEG